KPTLHLYIELNGGNGKADLASVLHGELMKTDPGYHDLAAMMEMRPLEVTVLRQGTFKDYYREKQENGSELAQRRPPRMNTPDDVVEELLILGGKRMVHVA
ncbi:MAG: GH3 auxin-responsive promoter family protein, partial [Dehalococcoidales bacterium]|nr:GH3 auxin-responsive promoter family protein [Dehalococcoidales bacterium]